MTCTEHQESAPTGDRGKMVAGELACAEPGAGKAEGELVTGLQYDTATEETGGELVTGVHIHFSKHISSKLTS